MSEANICTTSGRPVDVVRQEQTETTGQHKDYVILCEEERAKGFVRPYRDSYIHVGRSVCANTVGRKPKLGGNRNVCGLPFGHEGKCDGPFFTLSQPEHAALLLSHRKGGCGTLTKMSQPIAETYARDPSFYGATYCCACMKHLPVNEFEWKDGQTLGS